MIAGAVQRYLQAQGFDPVRVLGKNAGMGDYRAGEGPVWGVGDDGRGDFERFGGHWPERYRSGLMIRCRDDDSAMAKENVRRTIAHIRALRGQTISYTLPDGSIRSYRVTGVRRLNGPSDYPTQGGGYEATSNYELRVEDVP